MSFDTLAPFYRLMESIAAGKKLQHCRTAFLDEIPPPRRILLAGEGHGRSLPEFVRRFPEAEITVVDFSSRMLDIARKQLPAPNPAVEFIHADLLTWDSPRAGYDLIVTNFFLDCFPPEQLSAVVSKLATLATPSANWLLADFEIPPHGPAKWRSRIIVGLLYAFFRIVCGLKAKALVPPENDLKNSGFHLHQRLTRDWGLLKSEWWQRPPMLSRRPETPALMTPDH